MTTSQSITVRPVTVRRTSAVVPCRQSCILVRDASISMEGEKAAHANAASQALVHALAEPQNNDAFRCAVVDFAGNAETVHALCTAHELAGQLKPIEIRPSTDIAEGLAAAAALLEKDRNSPSNGAKQAHPVVVLYSDGGHNGSGSPQFEADRLKQNLGCTIVTVAFGSDADEDLLRKLASSPVHFYRAKDGFKLRDLFAAVGRTMSVSLKAGVDPQQALGGLK